MKKYFIACILSMLLLNSCKKTDEGTSEIRVEVSTNASKSFDFLLRSEDGTQTYIDEKRVFEAKTFTVQTPKNQKLGFTISGVDITNTRRNFTYKAYRDGSLVKEESVAGIGYSSFF